MILLLTASSMLPVPEIFPIASPDLLNHHFIPSIRLAAVNFKDDKIKIINQYIKYCIRLVIR
jgi:hypothetical protein